MLASLPSQLPAGVGAGIGNDLSAGAERKVAEYQQAHRAAAGGWRQPEPLQVDGLSQSDTLRPPRKALCPALHSTVEDDKRVIRARQLRRRLQHVDLGVRGEDPQSVEIALPHLQAGRGVLR